MRSRNGGRESFWTGRAPLSHTGSRDACLKPPREAGCGKARPRLASVRYGLTGSGENTGTGTMGADAVAGWMTASPQASISRFVPKEGQGGMRHETLLSPTGGAAGHRFFGRRPTRSVKARTGGGGSQRQIVSPERFGDGRHVPLTPPANGPSSLSNPSARTPFVRTVLLLPRLLLRYQFPISFPPLVPFSCSLLRRVRFSGKSRTRSHCWINVLPFACPVRPTREQLRLDCERKPILAIKHSLLPTARRSSHLP